MSDDAVSDDVRPAFLIAGAGGMLGTALQRVLGERGFDFDAPPESDFDITSADAVRDQVADFTSTLRHGRRGVLINAAAYTDVERAEDEPERAYRVNEHGAALLAREAQAAGLGFVQVSTDYVFDGRTDRPYREDDATNPLSVYGASKLAGEKAVAAIDPDALIVRTAWTFGPGGRMFPDKILDAARTSSELRVVTDEVGSPTYTLDLAGGIERLVAAGATGVVHLTAGGSCSRFELAVRVLELAGLERDLVPVSAAEFPSKAVRPRNSVLDCSRAASLGVRLPDWADGIARYIASRPVSGPEGR